MPLTAIVWTTYFAAYQRLLELGDTSIIMLEGHQVLKSSRNVSLTQDHLVDATMFGHVTSLERSVSILLQCGMSGVQLVVLLPQDFALLDQGIVHVGVEHVPLVEFGVLLFSSVAFGHVAIVSAN